MLTVGRHRLLASPLSAAAAASVMGTDRAALAYTDPPWGPGNLKYWRTKNGEASRPDWPAFVAELVAVIGRHCSGWVFVEMGLRWADEVSGAFAASGLTERHRHVMDYGKPPRPNALLALHRAADWPDRALPRWGWAATEAVAGEFGVPGHVLFDPCVGLGASASYFARVGMAVRGLDLNPGRLAVAARRLTAC